MVTLVYIVKSQMISVEYNKVLRLDKSLNDDLKYLSNNEC